MRPKARRHRRATPARLATVAGGAAALVIVAAIALSSCDRKPSRDAERFCADVTDSVDELRRSPTNPDEVDDVIELWRDFGDRAPLAIEPEWNTVADNLETAWTSDNPQEIYASMFASEPSAVAVTRWLADTCALDFGTISTIVPQTVAQSVPVTGVPG